MMILNYGLAASYAFCRNYAIDRTYAPDILTLKIPASISVLHNPAHLILQYFFYTLKNLLADHMKTVSTGIPLSQKNDPIERKHPSKNNYPWSESTDSEIWKAYKGGNKEAFIYIYKTYNQLLYNYGMQFCFNHEMIKDCIQETFFYLQKKSKHLSEVRSIRYYLYKILRRKLMADMAEEKKYRLIKEPEGKKFEIIISPELKLIDAQLDEERKSNLQMALNKLPERQREAILLFYYEGFTHDEVAQIMGLKTDKYSRKLIYRGITTLRRLLLSAVLLMFGYHITPKLLKKIFAHVG